MISLVERCERNLTVNVADSIAQALKLPLWRLVMHYVNLDGPLLSQFGKIKA